MIYLILIAGLYLLLLFTSSKRESFTTPLKIVQAPLGTTCTVDRSCNIPHAISAFQECGDNNKLKKCMADECEDGYEEKSGKCGCTTGETMECDELDLPNGAVSGTRVCKRNEYSVCQATECDETYYLTKGKCLPRTCNPEDEPDDCTDKIRNSAEATKTCVLSGSISPNVSPAVAWTTNKGKWGACVLKKCDAGFTVNSTTNHCVPVPV